MLWMGGPRLDRPGGHSSFCFCLSPYLLAQRENIVACLRVKEIAGCETAYDGDNPKGNYSFIFRTRGLTHLSTPTV